MGVKVQAALFPEPFYRPARTCAWCTGPIPEHARADAKTCGKRCRQAVWRFQREIARGETAASPLRLAYADPPYVGLSARYYREHPDYRGEVDHRALLLELATFDGWALSCSSESLPYILWLAVELELEVRVASWHRGERRVRTRGPVEAWEPVVYAGGRHEASVEHVADTLELHARPRTTDPKRVMGAKPAGFCSWLFGLLGARAGDSFDDLFPGSGGVMRAWRIYSGQAS